MSLRLGTRGSALALAQAQSVAAGLGSEVELVTITTSGDRGEAVGDKERWTRELDAALLDGRIDLAVHSAKDVPGELAAGIVISAAPPRGDPRDALCGSSSIEALPAGARLGTSSLRRAAQIRALREDLEIIELRGNVDTRLKRLAEDGFDAIVLALAGLQRLGRVDAADAALDPATFVPAPGQGVLAIMARAGEEHLAAGLGDPDATACLAAERAVVRALGASCRTPVGAYARRGSDGLELTCFAGLPDGSHWIRDELAGDIADPPALGLAIAGRMLAAGAAELIAAADAAA